MTQLCGPVLDFFASRQSFTTKARLAYAMRSDFLPIGEPLSPPASGDSPNATTTPSLALMVVDPKTTEPSIEMTSLFGNSTPALQKRSSEGTQVLVPAGSERAMPAAILGCACVTGSIGGSTPGGVPASGRDL